MEVHAEYLKELEKRSQRRMQALKGETGSENDQNTFCGREVIRSGSGKLFFTGVELYDREGKRESVFEGRIYVYRSKGDSSGGVCGADLWRG